MVSPVETAQCDVAVIGAGVVGLAVARALALAGREVLILEAAPSIGTVTSSRNSEVIHAGIYYPAGSLMAKFCVRGRRLLYEFCASHGVGHNKCGKLIVACDAAEPAKLADIAKRAAVNGVEDMRVLSAAEAIALEPALHCTGASSPAEFTTVRHSRRIGSAPPTSNSMPSSRAAPRSTGALRASAAP
jgi:L-2-hydroxyglutarate oxidase LhgO